MAQYKASMERISGHLEAREDPSPLISGDTPKIPQKSTPQPLKWLQEHAKFLLMPVLPLCWCLLVVCYMSRDMLLSAYAMPLLGIASASLANAVPVGGGVVFVPVLHLLGFQLQLGASFTVATMTFGNGVAGFLTWLQKDPSSIAWNIVPYAVVPAWIGAAWGVYHPFLSTLQCKQLFAIFCITVALTVGRGIYLGQKQHDTVFSIVTLEQQE